MAFFFGEWGRQSVQEGMLEILPDVSYACRPFLRSLHSSLSGCRQFPCQRKGLIDAPEALVGNVDSMHGI